MPRLCPQCESPLESPPGVAGALTCRPCERIWLPRAAFEVMLREGSSAAVPQFPPALQEIAPRRTTRLCPDDAERLHQVRQRGLEFLQCLACGGSFLAPADLRLLVERTLNAGRQLIKTYREANSPEPGAKTVGVEGSSVAKAAVEVLLRIFTPFI